MKHLLKKLLCMVLVVMLFVSTIPTQVYAAEIREERLPEIALGEDILGYDVFYLASATASIEENSRTVYLLRVGRGGPADSESTALVKIADMTAKYGEDYIVRVRDERTKVENPEDNFSLMEMIEGSDFEQQPITDDEEVSRLLQTDPEAQKAYVEGVNTAMEFLEEASGLKDKYGDDDPYAAALNGDKAYSVDDDAALYEGALPANGNGEVITIDGKDGKKADEPLDFDPVQQAANLFTGQNATAQRLTTESDMFQDLQAIANVMTDVVVGASVELTFKEGETEKFLEIVPKDNKVGDGNRMFYVILGAPSGKTTNSAASTCAFTIVDDEGQEPAVVSFSDASYTHEPGAESVTVTVLRSGAINTVISARVTTTGEGTAQAGRDYAEVDSELVFPFGVDHLTLDIPVRTEYLSGEGSFGIALESVAGCEVGETATATVTIQGTYTDKAGLLAAENAKLMGEDGYATLMAGNNMSSNNLSTIKTLDAIDLTKPFHNNSVNLENGEDYKFKGSNGWDSAHWRLEWIASGSDGDEGVCSVEYELTKDPYEAFFLAGAQVNWDRTLNRHDHAWMKVGVGGSYSLDDHRTTLQGGRSDANNKNYLTRDKNGNYTYWYPYDSTRDFDWEVRNIYPHENAIWADKQGGEWVEDKWVRQVGGDHPDSIEIMNIGKCDDCAVLWVGEIKPILRPFQVTVRPAQELTYLKADGSRGLFTDTTTEATLVEAGAHGVYFENDTFTVKTVAGTNVRQYAYMSGLELLNGKDKSKALYTLMTNADPSVNTLAYTLNTDNMKPLILAICPRIFPGRAQIYIYRDFTNWIDLLRDNTNTVKNSNSNVDGVPTYVDFSVRPTLAYLDATVTLRNPYSFPVTFTISGKAYTVAGGQTMQIKAPDGQSFHKGDVLCISAVAPEGLGAGDYVSAGVKYWAKFQTTSPSVDKEGTWDFLYQEPIYVGEQDQRLTYSEIVIEPNLQAKTNKIQVRVKTAELSHFDTTIVRDDAGNITHFPGVLATKGTVQGEYTYFTFANENGTFNGRTYAVTATPLSENEVCVWTDPVALKTYEGNTFYFTAGDTPERNLITLAVEPAKAQVTLQGTLRYANFNLRTGYEGNESMTPAVGAVLAAGSAGGVAGDSGFVSAGPITVTGKAERYLRYIVSVNGTDVIQEIPLSAATASGTTGATPALLLDFNGSDMAMDKKVRAKSNIQWTAYDGGDADAYTFTTGPNGKAGLVAINTDDTDSGQMRYMKLRVKNLNGKATNFRLYASINGGNLGAAYVVLPISGSSEWTDYVVDLTKLSGYNADAWKGAVTYIRFDLGWVPESFAIDYVAFFGTEAAANTFRSGNVLQLPQKTLDISSNFPQGVSPATSGIFKGIRITGKVVGASGQELDDWSIQNGASIPVVTGREVEMTIEVERSYYSYNMTGEDGRLIVKEHQLEKPLAVQFVLCDANGNFKGVYDRVTEFELGGDDDQYYIFHPKISFLDTEEEEGEESGDEKGTPLIPDPGDRLYLRLTTNRLAQTKQLRTADDANINEYQYADVYTGMDFYQPLVYQVVKMGIEEPIKIEFDDLPLVGSTGMNLNFPFVNVGIMKLHNGFRIYIGVSPFQIMDTVKKTHLTSMSAADGKYWSELFSIGDPFGSFKEGFMTAWNRVGDLHHNLKDAGEWGSKAAAGLGAPSWKFDMSIGIYFDFYYANVTQEGKVHRVCELNGVGGYVNVALGFQMAWYIILPVVFIPAYFGIEISGNFLGFLGADLNKDIKISYDDSLNGNANINDGIDRINGGIRALFTVQISVGIGLCGVLGIRGAGMFDSILNWEPRDPNGAWGWYPKIKAGFIVDLLLFSVPLMFNIKGWYLGSFKRYADGTSISYTPEDVEKNADLMGASETGSGLFQLREGNGDSTWVGNQAMLMGAFAPNKNKQKTLVTNAYERPDSQLITLSDNETVVLAFLDSDTAKGAAQRTTLKMATYANGAWSDAVAVSGDGTADFQPSIAETRDGKILVAWVSPADASAVDLGTDDGVMTYLNSMEVYAAFVELDGNKQIKTKDGAYGICADTEVTRISNDHYVKDGKTYTFYDANPTVVCDMESGDAMVYFIKSGRYSIDKDKESIDKFINPYTNDCVVCYMPYNAEADTDKMSGKPDRTVPAGWLFNNFYYSELGGVEANEKYIIDNYGGQRFLDGPVNGDNERYAIPDFTAVGYNGLAVYAYTVDTDGVNDTDADKELMLQVYDFRNHETKFRIRLTDDDVADALPQLFRSRVNGQLSTEDDATHTKLFWYRGGKQAVYIDVTDLLQNGINNDGSLKTQADGSTNYTYHDKDGNPFTEADTREYTYVGSDGKTHNKFTEPRPVWFVSDADGNAALSQADFRAVEDAEGNLYLLWTEGVTDENGISAREIFGTGLVGYETTDETGNTVKAYSGWSKPYRITRDGYTNDELAVAMSGDNLMTVHNSYSMTLNIPDEDTVVQGDKSTYSGATDKSPLTISDLRLIADVLEPCGSMETESIALYRHETVTLEDGTQQEVNILTTRPVGGETVTVQVEAANNGMNVAKGYKLSLYAGSTLVGEIETTEALAPGSRRSHSFEYTLPANVNGLVFKAVAQEMRDAANKQYYADTHTFTAEPLTAEAIYAIENVETYQTTDGFHAKFKVTNTGNAASGATDTLNITLCGPANIADQFTKAQIKLYSAPVSLAIGASRDFDVPVSILPAMMENYKFVTASVAVEKTYAERSAEGTKYLGTPEYADFDLAAPMNMAVQDVSVGVGQSKAINCTMDLGDAFNGMDDVTYAVDDLSVARIDNGKVLGVSNGTTTLNATHAATGATVSAKVTVTGESAPDYYDDTPSTPSTPAEITVAVTGDEGSVAVKAAVEGNTATVTAPTAEQLAEITDKAGETGKVVIDLSSLSATVTAVAIPAETVKAINASMEEGAEGLTIKLPNSTVTFDAKALAAIAAQTDGKELKLCVEPKAESSLNTKQQEAISELDVQAVYDVYMISGGKRISDFGGGTAAVEVSYPVPEGKNPGGFAVWYVADTGEKTEEPTTATRKAVRWTVTHFSSYVLVYDATRISACARDESCPMSAFTDLDLSAWYHDGVHWALDNSVMNGVGGGLFDPNGDTSRAMIVTMLYRMEGEPKSDYAMTFADVAEGQWYTEAVRWAAENGIVTGYDTETFGPSDKLTREQLATILCRYAKYKGVETALGETTPLSGFNDTLEVSDWAIKSVRWAVDAGIINGVGDGTLSPKTSATRAQVATMLMRYDGLGA